MKRKLKCCAALLSAGLMACSAQRSLAQSFASSNDLVVLQTNGDSYNGTYSGGDSVSLLDLSVNRTVNAGVVGLGVSLANTINLPSNTLSYNVSSSTYNTSTQGYDITSSVQSGLGLVLPDFSSVVAASHSGQLTLSQDGHSISFGTYLAPIGTINYFGTPYSPNGVTPGFAPRVINTVNSAGSVNTAAILNGADDYSASELRQVTTLDGTQFWISGNGPKPGGDTGDFGGFRYATSGATATTSLNVQDITDIRTSTIYQGQLYSDSGSNNSPPGEHTLSRLGSGLQANSAPSWNPLPATGGFFNGTIFGNESPNFITLNNGASVVYESDSTEGAITKWTLISGVWNYSGEVVYGKDAIENVVARLNGDGSVSIFANNHTGTNGAGNIYSYTDNGGAGQMNLSGLSFTVQSGNNVYQPSTPIYTGVPITSSDVPQQFWGLSFAPSTSKAVENQIWGNLNGSTGATGGSWRNSSAWSALAIPDASGSTATFGPALTSSGTITLDGTQTVGHVVFNDGMANYTILAGTGGVLDVDNTDPNSSSVPSIFNSNGSHNINAPILLAAGVTIASHYQASLSISGNISGVGPLQVYGPGVLTLSGSSSYSGQTIVHSGPVVVTATGSLPTTTDLTVGDSSDTAAIGLTASLTFNASTGSNIRSITLHSLSLATNGAVFLPAPSTNAGRSVVVTGGLSFAGATNAWGGLLDLSSNDLIVHNGSLADITNQVKAGYNIAAGGYWNGSTGIISSTAAADNAHLTALGTIQNVVYTNFDLQPVVTTDVLVKHTYYGDANLDGVIDGSDYSLIDNGYNRSLTGWLNGDFNYDGVINGSDYSLIDNAYQNHLVSLAASISSPIAEITGQISSANGTAAVPEPSCLAFVGVVAISLLRRRRMLQLNW